MAYCSVKTQQTNLSDSTILDYSKPLFNANKTGRYHNLTDYLVGKIFRENADILGWTPLDLESPTNQLKLVDALSASFENILIDIANEEESSEFLKMSDEVIEDIANIILPNFNQFITHYFKFNPILTSEEFDLEEITELAQKEEQDRDAQSEDEVIDSKGKEFDRGAQDRHPLELTNKQIKILPRLVPRSIWNENTQQSELFINSHGLPEIANFSVVFNLLLDKLSGIKDYQKFIDTLQSVDTLRVIPEAKYILEILKISKFDKNKTINEVDLFVSFYQIFNKPKVPIRSTLLDKRGNFSFVDEVQGNKTGIIQQFNNNFQLGEVNPSVKSFIIRDSLNLEGYQIDNKATIPYPSTLEEELDFLSLLGIKFTGLEYFSDTPEEAQIQRDISQTISLLHPSLVRRLKAGQVLREPVSQLRESYSTQDVSISSEAQSINTLIKIEGKYSKITPSLTTRNVGGELQSLISLDNYFTITTHYLNDAQTLDELKQKPPFRNKKFNPLFDNSAIISFLFDAGGNKRTDRSIELLNISGSKIFKDNSITAQLQRNLSPRQRLIQSMQMVFNQGFTDTLRPETSNTFYGLSLLNKGNNTKLFSTQGFSGGFKSNSRYKKIIFNYLQGEIKRVKSYPTKLKENPTLPSSYGQFSIFKSVVETNAGLRNELLSSDFDIDSPIFDKFLDEFVLTQKKQVERLNSFLNYYGLGLQDIVPPNLKVNENTSVNDYLRVYQATAWVQNVEFTILFSGDTLFFKDPFKRFKGLSSPGDLAATLPLISDYRKGTYETSFHKKYSISGALGVSQRDNTNNFLSKSIVEYKPRKDYAYTQPDIVENIYDSIIKRDGAAGKYSKDYIKNVVLQKANQQDPADGQGYIFVDFYRELSIRNGFHTPELEIAFKYEGLVFRKYILEKNTLSVEEEKELEKLEKLITANPNKYTIPPLKMSYWGSIENSTVDVPVFDKFSLTPLLPSDVKNHPTLKKILQDMARKQVGYVKYESGTKAFKTTPIRLEDINSTEKFDELSTELLKLQIKPSITQKTTTPLPTQFVKLIFSGLFNEGKPINPEVQNLYENYIQILKSIQSIQSSKLLSELGITEEGVDFDKLINKLIKQAKSQKLNSNVIASLSKKLEDPSLSFEATGFLPQIIDLISGLADRRLRRFEVPGGDFVLVTNANRSKLNFYTYSNLGITEIDIRINLTKEHAKLLNKVHPDGQPIATLQRLNKLLEDDEWREENKKLLTVILDRVPTQGPNSMDVGIVREFLSPTLGNVVILPDEITYKSGTDFDYDKEKVLIPSFDEEGNLISFPENTLTEINETLDTLIQQKRNLIGSTQDYVRSLRQEYSDINKISKKENKELRKDLQTLRIERDIYVEYLRTGLITLQLESLNPQNFDQFLLTNVSDFINNIFSRNADIIKAEFDQDLISYYEILQQIENVREEIEFNINAVDLIWAENQLNIYETKEESLSQLFDLSDQIRTKLKKRPYIFENQSNKLIDIYSSILTKPEVFSELVIPNSTSTIDPIIDNISKLQDTSLQLPVQDQIFNALDNMYVTDTYLEGKDMLSPFAKDNTHQQLGIYQNQTIQKKYNRFGANKVISHYLLNSEEIDQIEKDDVISVSQREDVLGEIKQHLDSEFINVTVDSTKDPRFMLLNLNFYNVGVFNFMKNMGYPSQRIVLFLSQPVIEKFIEYQKNGLTKNEALAEIAKLLNIKITKKFPVSLQTEFGYNKLKSNPNIQIVSEKKLPNNRYNISYIEYKYLKPNDIKKLLYAIDQKDPLPKEFSYLEEVLDNTPLYTQLEDNINAPIESNSLNIRLLSHFLNTDEHNKSYRNIQNYFNFDTNKVSNPLDLINKESLRNTLIGEGLFTEEYIESVENNSILSAFINLDLLNNIFEKLFPILGNPLVKESTSTLYNEYTSNWNAYSSSNMRKLPKTIYADLNTSILFNLQTTDNQSFVDRNLHLLIKQEGKRTMIERLEALRNQPFYENLSAQFPILNNFTISKHRITNLNDFNGFPQYTFINNVRLIKPSSETTVEAESTIEQLDSLYNYNITGFSKEENELYTRALRRFMEDLFNVGLLQNGLSKSSLGFSEYIPYTYVQPLYAQAINNFQQLSKSNQSNFLFRFTDKFKDNNPKYFPIKSTSNGSYPNMNDYYYKFKYYKIKPDQLVLDEISQAMYDADPQGFIVFLAQQLRGYSQDWTPLSTPPPLEESLRERYGDSLIDMAKQIPVPTTESPALITSVTRSNKKEEYTITLPGGTTEVRNGYRLSIAEYPDFQGFITDSVGGWTIDELTTSKSLGKTFRTIKKALSSLPEYLNTMYSKPGNRSRLESVGLFIQPKNLPPINPHC